MSPIVKLGKSEAYSKSHAAFGWDHNIFNPLIQWAVLEWNGGESRRARVTATTPPTSSIRRRPRPMRAPSA